MRCKCSVRAKVVLTLLACVALLLTCASAQSISPDEAQAIAREAYAHGYPLVKNYGVIYAYFVDSSSPRFKAPWNQLRNTSAAANKAASGPASDAQTSQLGADLRAEPLVLTMPTTNAYRHLVVQELDLFAFDLAYAGGRSSGSEGGIFLLAGPGWKGDKPNGIKDVIRSTTEFAFVLYRRQFLGPAGADSKDKTRAEFKVQSLHEFLGEPAPTPAPQIDFMKPVVANQPANALQFFDLLNFLLRFCPDNPSQKDLMTRFAQLGIGPDADYSFNLATLSPSMKQALAQSASDAVVFQKRDYTTANEANAADISGTREFLESDSPRPAREGLDESNPMAAYATYWINLADSAGHRLDEPNSYAQPSFDQQILPMHAAWSLSVFGPTFSYLNPNPYNPYWIDGP